MNTRLDRMIQRARAPLSALQPVVPSVLAPEPPLREDLRETVSPPPASPRLEHSVPLIPQQRSAFSREQSTQASPVKHAVESSRTGSASSAENKFSLPHDETVLGPGPLSAHRTVQKPPERAFEKPAPDNPWPVATKASPSTSEPPPQIVEPRENLPAKTSKNVVARVPPPQQASSPYPPTAESAEPLIEVNVSIGSIDFRQGRPAEPIKRSESHPRVTLDSYLQRGKRDAR
ncbi:MAG: hypothetical protein WA419_22650 [Silvibacterium sp.]